MVMKFGLCCRQGLSLFTNRASSRRGSRRGVVKPERRLRKHGTSTEALLVANDWPLWSAIVGCAALSQMTTHTKIGRTLSAPLLAMIYGFIASLLGILPLACTAYRLIWDWFVPLAASLYLLETDLTTSLGGSGWIVPVFSVGALGTIVGTLVAWAVLGAALGPEGWKLASALCATYIGGSANFASTATALNLTSGPLLAAAVATDNIAMMVYLAGISVIEADAPNEAWTQHEAPPKAGAGVIDLVGLDPESLQKRKPLHEIPLTGLFLGLLSCALGGSLAPLLGLKAMGMAAMALVASFIAVAMNQHGLHDSLRGSRAAGSALMSIFFVAIGASCGSIGSVLSSAPVLFVFVLIQISVHLGFILLCCRYWSVPMMYILTASNANIGGPGTAAGMAAAKGWDAMVQPAVLLGCLGYSIANLIGILISYLLRRL